MNLSDHAGAGRGNGAHGFLGFKFHERLVFFDHLAFRDQDADDRATLYAFSELGKFYVHGENSLLLSLKIAYR